MIVDIRTNRSFAHKITSNNASKLIKRGQFTSIVGEINTLMNDEGYLNFDALPLLTSTLVVVYAKLKSTKLSMLKSIYLTKDRYKYLK